MTFRKQVETPGASISSRVSMCHNLRQEMRLRTLYCLTYIALLAYWNTKNCLIPICQYDRFHVLINIRKVLPPDCTSTGRRKSLTSSGGHKKACPPYSASRLVGWALFYRAHQNECRISARLY